MIDRGGRSRTACSRSRPAGTPPASSHPGATGRRACCAASSLTPRTRAGRLRSSTSRGCCRSRAWSCGSSGPTTAAQGPRAEDGRRALPRLADRPVAGRRRLRRDPPVQPARRRRERAPATPRPSRAAPRADGRPQPRRVRRVPGPAPSRRRRRDPPQRAPAPDVGRLVRVLGLGADLDGAAVRGPVPAAARARGAGRARPLPADATAVFLEERFRRTDRNIGNALDPLLAFTRGHPQRTMLVAHHLWDVVPRGAVGDETAFVDARSRRSPAPRPRSGRAGTRWRSTSNA